jgi:DNA-binding transcriptional MerR regulator
MAADGMPIGEFSRRTGCAIETIRFYEKVGVLPEAQWRGRYRQYAGGDIGRLIFVRRARELGFTLAEVRALLGLAALGGDACAEMRTLAVTHLKCDWEEYASAMHGRSTVGPAVPIPADRKSRTGPRMTHAFSAFDRLTFLPPHYECHRAPGHPDPRRVLTSPAHSAGEVFWFYTNPRKG